MRRTINTKNSSFDQGYVGEVGMRRTINTRIRRLIGMCRIIWNASEILRIRRLTRDVSDN